MSTEEETSASGVPVLSERESKLFEVINRTLSAEKSRRWNELIATRDAEELTEDERRELIRLGAGLEQINAERLASIRDLSQLRGISFETMCRQLEIATS